MLSLITGTADSVDTHNDVLNRFNVYELYVKWNDAHLHPCLL